MFNTAICVEKINRGRRINTSDRVEVLLDRNLLDQQRIENGLKRIVFSVDEELVFLLATIGVTRYKLNAIDVLTGLVWFEILEIGGYSYKNEVFQQQFLDFALIPLPQTFCVEIKHINMMRTANNRLNEKHGYTTLTDLAYAKPDRTEKLIQLWHESGIQALRALCHFDRGQKLASIGRTRFWNEITRGQLNESPNT
jgi:hypothetical protein